MTTSPTAYERFEPWRRTFEIGFWLASFAAVGVANSATALIDVRRTGLAVADWEPAVWEWSSAVAWLLLVMPIATLSRHFPVQMSNWPRVLLLHIAASTVASLLHVAGMVGMRIAAYRVQGASYDPGPLEMLIVYEYLKDWRSYASIVALIEWYRLVLRRLQGEVHLLAAPDEGPPVEPVERPSRFLVRKVGREFLVAADDVEWLQAWGNYVNLRVRGHDYPWRGTMAAIEARLDPARFLRVHRSYIVNLDHVASIEPLGTGDARVHLRDGSVVPCSRRYRNGLRERAGLVAAARA